MYKLTLDLGLANDPACSVSMKRLMGWKDAGWVEIAEAGAPRSAGASPAAPAPSSQNRWSSLGTTRGRAAAITSSGNATFKLLAAILFPTRDSSKLRMTEINQVVFLIRHHSVGNDIFVTSNTAQYLAPGRRERLRNAFGIVAMTPEETVEALDSSFGPGYDERMAPKSA